MEEPVVVCVDDSEPQELSPSQPGNKARSVARGRSGRVCGVGPVVVDLTHSQELSPRQEGSPGRRKRPRRASALPGDHPAPPSGAGAGVGDAGGPASGDDSDDVVVEVPPAAVPKQEADKHVNCFMCDEALSASQAAGCTARVRKRHHLCAQCLEGYVQSQYENLGHAFASHQGNMPCSGLGHACHGHFAKESIVAQLAPLPGNALGRFLNGLLVGGRVAERQVTEQELERLRAKNAELKRKERDGKVEDRVVREVNLMADMLADQCPHCGVAMLDFDGCFVVQCGNQLCKQLFCAWCNGKCPRDNKKAHEHVRSCANNRNPGRGYYGKKQQYEGVRRERAIAKVLEHMRTVDDDIRQRVWDRADFLRKDLGLSDAVPGRARAKPGIAARAALDFAKTAYDFVRNAGRPGTREMP